MSFSVICLQDTTNENCLRLFLSYHGLSLLWSWMVDLTSTGGKELKLLVSHVICSIVSAA